MTSTSRETPKNETLKNTDPRKYTYKPWIKFITTKIWQTPENQASKRNHRSTDQPDRSTIHKPQKRDLQEKKKKPITRTKKRKSNQTDIRHLEQKMGGLREREEWSEANGMSGVGKDSDFEWRRILFPSIPTRSSHKLLKTLNPLSLFLLQRE